MVIGFLSLGYLVPAQEVGQFLISVTYLMASSLIFTGGACSCFLRAIFLIVYLKNAMTALCPTCWGILFLVTLTAALFAILIILFLFAGTTIYYKVVMFSNFIVLCNLWIVIIFLSGMKAYNRILITMLFGYSVMIGGKLFAQSLEDLWVAERFAYWA